MQARIQTMAAVLTAFAATVNGHIVMKSPVPFGSVGSNKVLTTSPLTSANYPCQVGSNPATFYSKDGIDNKMEIGTPQKISFDGSAVHGGGSCQLALTKDPQPSASTSWQVILSIEGGCPSKTGNGVDEYEFTIPDSIEPGDWVLAWTWISKLSGTQEYYMNCAPLTLTGGAGKRDISRNETMELFTRGGPLPELMVANLAEINDCKSQLSTDPTYPNPGPNVITPGTSYQPAPIRGSGCVPKGAKEVTPGSGPSSGSGSSSSPAPDHGPGTSSAAEMSPTSTAAAATTASSAPGGVFVTSSETSGFVTVTIKTSTISTDTATSSAAIPSSSAFDSPSATPLPSPSSSAPASGPSGSPTPGSGKTGACSTEGMFNCLDGTSYQQCASGGWSVLMTMPPTTKCALGESMTLWARSMSNDQGTRQINRRGY
ncbi:hypothetical protein EKO27_g1859 [Xylaria grammica]|uniref:Chitin-binding type-4 domain-containing protein n=1 Tax=Xylaria grammica TaxID=363999 RepID=A0A439DFR3_9PEZI|nr:hypothetical protein EKO27_g1859 [Xylaria grammica]